MENVVIVAIGGAIGAVCRYVVSVFSNRFFTGSKSVTGTVIANSSGCFLAGILMAAAANQLIVSPIVLLFFATGILGAFTTFSTFSLELYNRLFGSRKTLFVYIFLQIGVGIGLFVVGYAGLNQLVSGGWFG